MAYCRQTNFDPHLCGHMASLDVNDLTYNRGLYSWIICTLTAHGTCTKRLRYEKERLTVNELWAYYIMVFHCCDHSHDDVIKWKHFLRYWPFVRGIHRSPVNSSHKGQWRGALMFSLIWACINDWVNYREAGYLRHHRAHYDIIIMSHIPHHIQWPLIRH